jgi:hypothetical protein
MIRWTCLDCGKSYNGRFSDPCPECGGGRAIIDNSDSHEKKPENEITESENDFIYLEVAKSIPQPVILTTVTDDGKAIECVSKINKTNDRHIGRPRLKIVIKDQMSFADLPKMSLRKRATLLGVSAATVMRMDRRKATELNNERN